jgi:hypothetical protein
MYFSCRLTDHCTRFSNNTIGGTEEPVLASSCSLHFLDTPHRRLIGHQITPTTWRRRPSTLMRHMANLMPMAEQGEGRRASRRETLPLLGIPFDSRKKPLRRIRSGRCSANEDVQ